MSDRNGHGPHQPRVADSGRDWSGGETGPPVLPPVDLGQIAGMLRRQIWLLVAGLVVGTGLAIYLVRPEPLSYSARSAVRVNYDRRSFTGGIADDPAMDPSLGANPIQSQLQVLTSETVLSSVVDGFGL
jgi:uncharacterized protein involved in exopolysaccharide biosynthesis